MFGIGGCASADPLEAQERYGGSRGWRCFGRVLRHRCGTEGLEPSLAVIEEDQLNPAHTFETFVVSAANRFAHAAAVAVAESPAGPYNPLFIYGGPGLGETHLLQAIRLYAEKVDDTRIVRYVAARHFIDELLLSPLQDETKAFRRRYREVDILLIDDIQVLADSERAQDEFFHTFNALHDANKQIVISSNRSPRQLFTLDDRLRTRFEWGLIADIQPPDQGTLVTLRRK